MNALPQPDGDAISRFDEELRRDEEAGSTGWCFRSCPAELGLQDSA
jgi:hypothetical protein